VLEEAVSYMANNSCIRSWPLPLETLGPGKADPTITLLTTTARNSSHPFLSLADSSLLFAALSILESMVAVG